MSRIFFHWNYLTVDRQLRRMTYIKKITSTMIYADKYADFMINADKSADSMFNTKNF